MKEKRMAKRYRLIWLGLVGIFGLLLALSVYMIVHPLIQSWRERAAFETMLRAAEQKPVQVADHPPAPPPEPEAPAPEPEPEPEPVMLPALAPLYEQNADLAGWLTVPGTQIDYPVMLTPDNPDYYLDHAFDGTASKSGVPFIGAGSNADSDYLVIHGHNMRNDTMFGSLDLYKSEAFWRENPVLRFDALFEAREYEVFAAVYTRILYQNEPGFRYYQLSGDLTEAQFAEMTGFLTSEAAYETGITPAFGDQILVLSTCSYQTENGRFIVAARKIT